MKKIDKAKGVGYLLDAKGRYDKARALSKPQVAYEIITWRKYLGMKITTYDDVTERVRSSPVDMSKTLAASEYTKQIKIWLPESYIDLSSCGDENAKGAAKALQTVLLRFPKLAERDQYGEGYLDMFSTSQEFDKFQRAHKRNFSAYRSRVVEREGLLKRFDQEYGDKILEFSKKVLESPNRETLSYTSAKNIAAWFQVQDVASIKRVYKEPPVDTKKFLDMCRNALQEKWVGASVRRIIREGNPWLDRLACHSVRSVMEDPNCLGAFSRGGWSKGIVLGKSFSSDKDLTEKMKRSVESGWSPKVNIDTPTKAAEMVVVHELGHALDALLGLQHSAKFIEFQRDIGMGMYKWDISAYSRKNYGELIAEAFVDYMLSDNPKPISRRIGKMIAYQYEQRFGGSK